MRCRLAYVIVSVIMLCFLSPNVIAQTNQNQQTLPEAVQDKAETIKDETGLKSISSEQYDAIIIVMLVIVLWGTISGFRQNTTVFYNFDDLALCFGMIASPAAIGFVWMIFNFSVDLYFILSGIAVLACLLGVLQYTWKSGVRGMFPVVFVTKVFWGTLTMLAIWWLLSPPGKNAESRRSARAFATMFLLLAAPVVARLVKYKEGRFFNPTSLSRSGITNIGKIRNSFKGDNNQ